MKESWTLKEILGYQTGSSWDGGHFRDITVSYVNEDNVKVSNSYMGSCRENTFTLDEIAAQLPAARETLYFSDFCCEAVRAIPYTVEEKRDGRITGIVFQDTPRAINAAVNGGLRRNMPAAKPPKFRPGRG